MSRAFGYYEDSVSKGIALSVLASVLFAVMYFYTSLLAPLTGVEIFGWRMLLTLPCMTLFMILSGEWHRVGQVLRQVASKPLLSLALLLSAALVGVQLWLFMWAPLNGYSLDVSLGYFLLPLTMVLTGRIVYGERLSRLQKVATLLACLGVLNELYQVGSFSWATLVVALGYPVYFVLRRRLGTDHLGGLWLDMALLIPAAWWFVQGGEQGFAVVDNHPGLYLLIPLLGGDQRLGAGVLRHRQPLAGLQPVRPAQLCGAGVAAVGRPAAGGKHQGRGMADLHTGVAGGAGAGARRGQAPAAPTPQLIDGPAGAQMQQVPAWLGFRA